MPQSLSYLLTHIVFSTKNRAPVLDSVVLPALHAYLATVARNTDCECFRVGGVADHVHLAVRLSRTLTIAKELGKDYPKLETDCRNSADIGRNSA